MDGKEISEPPQLLHVGITYNLKKRMSKEQHSQSGDLGLRQ